MFFSVHAANMTKYCTYLMHMQYTYPIHNVNKYCAVDTIKGHYFFFHILYISLISQLISMWMLVSCFFSLLKPLKALPESREKQATILTCFDTGFCCHTFDKIIFLGIGIIANNVQ